MSWAGQLTINSPVKFINKSSEAGSLDFTQSTKNMSPNVQVKVYHRYADNTDELIGTLTTDTDGKISGTLTHPTITSFSPFFKVIMETNLAKVSYPWDPSIATFESSVLAQNVQSFSDTITISLTTGFNEGGSANILKSIYEMDQWMKTPPRAFTSIGQLTVEQHDNESLGYMEPTWIFGGWLLNHEIHVGDPEMFTREVIYHEYAHAIMYEVYGHFPSGSGPETDDHYIDSESSPGFALVEGWAEFMEIAVSNNLGYWFNLETNQYWKGTDGDGTNNSGEIVEGAVASVFWDIHDPASASDDDGIADDFVTLKNCVFNNRPDNFKEFWDCYISYGTSAKKQSFRKICEKHGIIYSRGKITKLDSNLDGTFQAIGINPVLGETAAVQLEIIAPGALNLQTSAETTQRMRLLVLNNPLPASSENAFIDARLFDPAQWALVGEDASSADGFKFNINSTTLGLQDGEKYAFLAQAIDQNDSVDTFLPDQRAYKSSAQHLKDLNTLVSFMIDKSPPVAQLTITPGPDLDGNQSPDVSVSVVGEFPSSPIALSIPPALDISAFAVSAQDSGSGIVSAYVKEDGAVIFTQDFNPPSKDPQPIPKLTLKNGSLYELSVLDAVGNQTIARFYAAFTPPELKAVQVTPLRQPDDSTLHTVQFTASDAVWLRDARLIERSTLEALIPGFGDDSWGNHWDEIVQNSLPRTGPPQATAWLSPGTKSQRYLYEGVPNGDYVAFAVSASSIIGRQAAFAFKDVTHDVVIYDGNRLAADCVHLELKAERPRVVDETNLFAGTVHLRQAAPGTGFIQSGLLTVPVGGRSNAGATVSTKFNNIRVDAGPILTTQIPGGEVIVTGLGGEQTFTMDQSTVTLADGSAVAFEAVAAFPQNILFADGGQPVADTWRPVKNGDLLTGARARLRATLTASPDAMGAPYLTQVVANVTDHEVILTQTGTPDPAMGRFPIPAGTNVTVSGTSPRGNTATVTVPFVSAPGELALVDVPLNADSQCPVTSGLPTPDLLLDVGVLSNGAQAFELEMALGANACQAGSGAALIHEGTAGTENITGEVTTSCGIKGTALSASPFYVNVPTGADRLPPVTGWDVASPRDDQGRVVIGSPAVLPLVAADAGSEVQLTEAYVDSGPFTIVGGMVELPEGFHDAYYRSRDSSANLEATRHSRIRVDATPPFISAFFPSSGTFGFEVSSFTVAWLLTDLDPAPTAQARLVQIEDTGAPNPGSTVVVVALGQLFFAPELDDGSWVLEVNAQDWVLNSTVAYSQPFRIVHPLDSTPPVTQLTLGPPSVVGDPSFVSSQTVISLSASDDLSGVASLTYLIDGSTTVVSASSASFSLTQEGPHTLAFFAVDSAGNVEAVQVSSITVDNTPPLLAFTLSGSSLTDRLGRTVISTSTQLLLSAADALAGVGALAYSLDGGPEVSLAVSSLALVFPEEGSHTLSFYARDRVENGSLSFSTSVVADVSVPAFGALSAAGADGSSGSDSAPISTTAASVQIAVSDLASGLDVTGAGSGPSPLSVVPGTLGLWHFDEAPDSRIATNVGGPAGDGTLNFNVSREAGILGGAVRIGANPVSRPDAGVTLSPAAYSVINNMAAGTIELWAKLEQDSTISNMRHVFTLKQHDGSNTEFEFSVQNGPTNELWHASNGLDCNTLIQVDPTRWAHFAVTWDAQAAKLYKDGALVRTCNGSFPVPNDLSPTCLTIAGSCGDLTLNGTRLIDEVRVLNRALSAAEIAQDASDQAKPFAARLSTDGGLSFGSLSSVELSGMDGDVGPALFSASGLSLKASTSPADATNQVEFTVRDLAGHIGTVRKTLLVNLNRAVATQALSPADASSSSVPLVAFSWAPGPGVPAASITGYEFQYARDEAFTKDLVTLSPSTGSAAVALPEGAFYWRVAAFDRFGEKSPYSAARRIFVDSQPPAFADAAVSTAPGAAFRPASLPVNGPLVSARASVRDLASGLRITPAPGGPAALTAVPGTLGLWHFDEPSGSVALGEGPAGNGTLNVNVSREAGILGGAVLVGPFSGSSPNAGVTLGPGSYPVINDLRAGTIELWAKLLQESTVGNMRHIFTVKHHDGVNTEFQFAIQQGPTNELWHASSGVDCNTLIQVDPTRWAHFAVTWDAQAARLYKDGAWSGPATASMRSGEGCRQRSPSCQDPISTILMMCLIAA